MKNRNFLFSLALIFSLTPALYGADAISSDVSTVSAPRIENNASSNPFSMTVTGTGKLIFKPGQLVHDGGDYTGIALPYLISSPKQIAYPRWALRQGWQGEVVIAIEILTNGSVGRSQVMNSSGHQVLDDAAVKAVKTWKFQPAMREGKSVLECIEIPINFELREE